MARRRGIDQQIAVTKGFLTEYSPVAFPVEAAIDIDNCIIDTDGSIRRRAGIDLEQEYSLNSVNGSVIPEATVDSLAVSTHLWSFVGNSGTLSIIVQQVGAILQFYSQVVGATNLLLGEVNLSPYAILSTELPLHSIKASSGLGDLYVVSPYLKPLRITYDGTSFSIEEIIIRIRDFDGLHDGLKLTERPNTLTRQHYYNLRNQGWSDANINLMAGLLETHDLVAATASGGVAVAVLGKDFPSNADIMSTGIITNSSGNLVFNGDFVRKSQLSNSAAPKGSFILEAFRKDYDEVLGSTGTGTVTIDKRPEAVAFHQGRIFFSSPSANNSIGGIYYSQQLITKDRVGNCYQEADPTAEVINELVDTDGGFLPAPGIGQIYDIKEASNGIAVVASNGVWFLTGADSNSGFSATNLKLQKISTIGAVSGTSTVEAESALYYFGTSGIMQLAPSQYGELTANNLTQSTIQTFYINISSESLAKAVGTYVPEKRRIIWTYPSTEGTTEKTIFLILDLEVQGFYKYSINDTTEFVRPKIVGIVTVDTLASTTFSDNILELNGTTVNELDGVTPLTEIVEVDSSQVTSPKCAVLVYSPGDAGYKVSFATFRSRSFRDWRAIDGVGIPMTSYVEFAENVMQAVHTKGSPTYVHSFFDRVSKNLQVGGYNELPPLD